MPGVQGLWCFNRGAVLHDGTLIVSVYAIDHDGDERPYVLRSEDAGRTWRLHDLCARVKAVPANETALCEVAPGRLIALTRAELGRGDHHLLQMWSDDGGRSWTEPIKTPIWGHPAHLLKLADGRILCTHGYRRPPLGVRAVLQRRRRRNLGRRRHGRPPRRQHRPLPAPGRRHRRRRRGLSGLDAATGRRRPDRLLRHAGRQRHPLRRYPLASLRRL